MFSMRVTTQKTARKKVRDERAVRLERRLAMPVIVAAAVCVPATFLSAVDGWAGQVGKILNWGSTIVLTGEPILLFLVTGRRLVWLRAHLWPILIGMLAVLALLFAVLPFQVLRLLRLVHLMTAARILRVNRILGAAETLRRFLHVDIFWRRVSAAGGPLMAFGFAGIVLADADSEGRKLMSAISDRFGPIPVVLVIALAVVVLAVVGRRLQRMVMTRIRKWIIVLKLRRKPVETATVAVPVPVPVPTPAAPAPAATPAGRHGADYTIT
jgi:hypothetical protein